MTGTILHAAAILCAVGAATIGGVFFAFSSFVMRALAEQEPAAGMRAMQAINRTVLNPWFLGTFLGTGALAVVLALAALVAGGPGAGWLAAGALLYGVGSVGVTVAGNVPLNDALAAADPDAADGRDLWHRYLRDWTRLNHWRTAASLGAAVLLFVGAG